MTKPQTTQTTLDEQELQEMVAASDTGARIPDGWQGKVLLGAALIWSLFQLWIASPLPYIFRIGVFNATEARSIHLAFAMFLAFMAYPALKRSPRDRIPLQDWLLARLAEHDWARDLADQLWLDYGTRAWAENVPSASAHRDANGAPLAQGDTVVLIKDLPVKGAGFTAKRGTAVRGISLVPDNPGQIEGRVEGQRIVILTEFVKKR